MGKNKIIIHDLDDGHTLSSMEFSRGEERAYCFRMDSEEGLMHMVDVEYDSNEKGYKVRESGRKELPDETRGAFLKFEDRIRGLKCERSFVMGQMLDYLRDDDISYRI